MFLFKLKQRHFRKQGYSVFLGFHLKTKVVLSKQTALFEAVRSVVHVFVKFATENIKTESNNNLVFYNAVGVLIILRNRLGQSFLIKFSI